MRMEFDVDKSEKDEDALIGCSWLLGGLLFGAAGLVGSIGAGVMFGAAWGFLCYACSAGLGAWGAWSPTLCATRRPRSTSRRAAAMGTTDARDAAAFLEDLTALTLKHRIAVVSLFDGNTALYPLDDEGRVVSTGELEGVGFGDELRWREDIKRYETD